MQDLKPFALALIKNRIIDVTPFVAQRNGQWTLTREFAGVTANTIFTSELDYQDRLAQGLVTQYQSHGGLRLVG